MREGLTIRRVETVGTEGVRFSPDAYDVEERSCCRVPHEMMAFIKP